MPNNPFLRHERRIFRPDGSPLWAPLRLACLAVVGVIVAGAAMASPPVRVIEAPIPFYDPEQGRVRMPGYIAPSGGQESQEIFPPLRVLISRERYWAEDGHLELIVQLWPEDRSEGAAVSGRIVAEDGSELHSFEIDPVPGANFAVFPELPEALLAGGAGELQMLLHDATGEQTGDFTGPFRVERFDAGVAPGGSVPLEVPNPEGITAQNLPFTVGVPFPRGAVRDTDALRLYRLTGLGRREIPLQVTEAQRWSAFGSLQWVHCDFVLDLDGAPVDLELGVGGDASRNPPEAPATARAGTAGPRVDAGRIRFDADGIAFDAAGDGRFIHVLTPDAISGGYVQHENGRFFSMPADDAFDVVHSGPEKVVLDRQGWFQTDDGAHAFCQYRSRYVLHRNSPVVRIFHTWTYTGDDKQDRIAGMGWRFPAADALSERRMLTSFEAAGNWTEADRLLQWDYEHVDRFNGAERETHAEARAAGAAAFTVNGVRVHFGVKDFWQNYPAELEFRDNAFWFNNWPRRNRPAGHTFAKAMRDEVGEPAVSASAARYAHEAPDRLTRSEWTLSLLQHRFAHEGELLNFALPPDLAHSPMGWNEETLARYNAQGISRTEEMWLVFEADDAGGVDRKDLLRGLNDETLRAVVDPAWVARSGALDAIHPQDRERFPDEEHSYEQAALSWSRLTERLGMYGMWIYGDLPAWDPEPERLIPSTRRSFRKQHLGWPYSWLPFARSGDPRLLKTAEANTRQLIDAAYCHYVSEAFAEAGKSKLGYWGIGPIYWRDMAGTHTEAGTSHTIEYLRDAWNLTGYHRAREHVDYLARLYKHQSYRIHSFGRVTNAQLKFCLDMYELTHDPWFLAAAHAYAQGHLHGGSGDGAGWMVLDAQGGYGGRTWDSGDEAFLQFTGSSEFREDLYLGRHVPRSVTEWNPTHYNRRQPQYNTKALAWRLTGDPYYLRRAAHAVDAGTAWIADGQALPEYLQGYLHERGIGTGYAVVMGYHLRWLPLALAVLAEADTRPDPIVTTFMTQSTAADDVLTLRMHKPCDREPLPIRLRAWRGMTAPSALHDSIRVDYTLHDPAGTVFQQGVWDYGERPHARAPNQKDLELPAAAPAGVYRLALQFREGHWSVASRTPGVALPVTPADIPEIVVLPEGGEMFNSTLGTFWFQVPEGVDRFQLQFHGRGIRDGLPMVWDPAGRRVWNQGDHASRTATIEAPPEHQGRLWRVTTPGRFRLDPQLPPILSVSPGRWFDPSSAALNPQAD